MISVEKSYGFLLLFFCLFFHSLYASGQDSRKLSVFRIINNSNHLVCINSRNVSFIHNRVGTKIVMLNSGESTFCELNQGEGCSYLEFKSSNQAKGFIFFKNQYQSKVEIVTSGADNSFFEHHYNDEQLEDTFYVYDDMYEDWISFENKKLGLFNVFVSLLKK